MSHVLAPALPESSAGHAPAIALRHILWACDFSGCSAVALRFAVPVARAFGSDITAIHVMPTTLPAGAGAASLTNPGLLRPRLHHDVSVALSRYVRPAVDASLPTHIALREGKPLDELLALAASLPADMIVLGTHGQSAIERAVLGSVAEGVLGRARCPVLAVPAAAAPPSGSRIDTVLFATDFSAHAARAQQWALSIAVKFDARLLVLHVVEDDTLIPTDERVREAEERLEATAAAGREAGCEADAMVTVGGASRAVVETAREQAVGLIVMGVEGPHAVHRLLLGSTAHRVVRDAPCPVLAVRGT